MNEHNIRAMLSMRRTQIASSRIHRYDGFVYLIYFPKLELFKIGHTRSTQKRAWGIKAEFGETFDILHTIKTNWPYAAEQILIAGCALEPIIGRETGRLTPEAVAEIRAIGEMVIEGKGMNAFEVKTTWIGPP